MFERSQSQAPKNPAPRTSERPLPRPASAVGASDARGEARPLLTKPVRIVAGACGALLALFAAYGIGRYDAGLKVAQLEREHLAQSAGQTKLAEALGAELDRERARTQRLQATKSLYHATIELSARNFGNAETRVKQAADHLEASQPEPESELETLMLSLRDTKVTVTDDVGAQRKALDQLGTRLILGVGESAPQGAGMPVRSAPTAPKPVAAPKPAAAPKAAAPKAP